LRRRKGKKKKGEKGGSCTPLFYGPSWNCRKGGGKGEKREEEKRGKIYYFPRPQKGGEKEKKKREEETGSHTFLMKGEGLYLLL